VTESWIGNHRVHLPRGGKLVPGSIPTGSAVTVSGQVIGPGGGRWPMFRLPFDYFHDRHGFDQQFAGSSQTRRAGFELAGLPRAGENCSLSATIVKQTLESRPRARPASVWRNVHATDGTTIARRERSTCRWPRCVPKEFSSSTGGNPAAESLWTRVSSGESTHAVRTKTDGQGHSESTGFLDDFRISASSGRGGLGNRWRSS